LASMLLATSRASARAAALADANRRIFTSRSE
jgi:hypothetical protein